MALKIQVKIENGFAPKPVCLGDVLWVLCLQGLLTAQQEHLLKWMLLTRSFFIGMGLVFVFLRTCAARRVDHQLLSTPGPARVDEGRRSRLLSHTILMVN